MINLLLLLCPLISFCFDFHFWLFLFSAVSIIRFSFNRLKSIFIISTAGFAILYFLPVYLTSNMKYYAFEYVVIFQGLICTISLIYNIKKEIWKEDVVFTFMEPVLIIILCGDFISTVLFGKIIIQLQNWLYIYIFSQILLVIVKIFLLYKMSGHARSITEKLKLILISIPDIRPSFGFNDLGVSGALYLYRPTNLDIIKKEFEFIEKGVIASLKKDKKNLEKIDEEYLNFKDKYQAKPVFKK